LEFITIVIGLLVPDAPTDQFLKTYSGEGVAKSEIVSPSSYFPEEFEILPHSEGVTSTVSEY
jgi:hypothetical protein